MAYFHKMADSPTELVDLLNGAVRGKELQGRIYGLNGLTFIVNDGGGDRTATFTDTAGKGLLVKDIIDTIKAAHANLESSTRLRQYGHGNAKGASIQVNTATYVVKGAGTANALLGFTNSDQTVTPITSSNIVSIIKDTEGGRFHVIHE